MATEMPEKQIADIGVLGVPDFLDSPPAGLPHVSRHEQSHRDRPRDDVDGITSASDVIDMTAGAQFAVHLKLGGLPRRATVGQAVQRRSSRCARDRRLGAEHVHRCASGTVSITASMCFPQPAQVVLPQPEHRAGEHIGGFLRRER